MLKYIVHFVDVPCTYIMFFKLVMFLCHLLRKMKLMRIWLSLLCLCNIPLMLHKNIFNLVYVLQFHQELVTKHLLTHVKLNCLRNKKVKEGL